MGERTQEELLKERIPYEEIAFGDETTYDKVIERLLDDSKYIGLSLRFPYDDYAERELPKKYNNWQLRCAEELYTLMGSSGVTSYSENGLSWTRDSSYLNKSLTNEIEALVGTVMGSDV